MNLSAQLAAMETTLQQLTFALKEMQTQVAKLEEENERLRQQITPVINENKDTAGGQKALQQLGFQAEVELQEGLEAYMKWYVDNCI